MEFNNEPIGKVVWVKAADLIANDYNPNVVFTAEMNPVKAFNFNQWVDTTNINNYRGYHN